MLRKTFVEAKITRNDPFYREKSCNNHNAGQGVANAEQNSGKLRCNLEIVDGDANVGERCEYHATRLEKVCVIHVTRSPKIGDVNANYLLEESNADKLPANFSVW